MMHSPIPCIDISSSGEEGEEDKPMKNYNVKGEFTNKVKVMEIIQPPTFPDNHCSSKGPQPSQINMIPNSFLKELANIKANARLDGGLLPTHQRQIERLGSPIKPRSVTALHKMVSWTEDWTKAPRVNAWDGDDGTSPHGLRRFPGCQEFNLSEYLLIESRKWNSNKFSIIYSTKPPQGVDKQQKLQVHNSSPRELLSLQSTSVNKKSRVRFTLGSEMEPLKSPICSYKKPGQGILKILDDIEAAAEGDAIVPNSLQCIESFGCPLKLKTVQHLSTMRGWVISYGLNKGDENNITEFWEFCSRNNKKLKQYRKMEEY